MEPHVLELLQQLGSAPELLEKLKGELPPELLATLSQKQCQQGAMSSKDLRRQAEAQAPTIYAEVLARYCHTDVIRQYDTLREEEKEKLLKALRITVEENFQHMSVQKMMKEQILNKTNAKASTQPVADSPLVRALRLVNQSESFQPDVLEVLQESLSRWGRKVPGDIRVIQHMMSYKDHLAKFRDDEKSFMNLMTNSTLTKPESATAAARNWHELQSIRISSLRLFGVASGQVLMGTLIVPPMVTVGITTLLQDDFGEVVQLGLYNQLPGGSSGAQAQDLAEKRFAKGSRLRIAEPFLKIFRDGNQGIRVDSPHDLRLEGPGCGSKAGELGLSECRQTGNELYKQGQFEAALQEYWQGLRSCDEVAVLLSNRAQAHLREQRHSEALRDAAASLLLRPQGAKHRARYVLALQSLGFPDHAQRAQDTFANSVVESGGRRPSILETREVLGRVLKTPQVVAGPTSEESHGGLKEKGNMAFREGRYSEAANFYTDSLACHPASEEVANLLRNVALSSIRAGLLHDAVAAAAASLRLQFHSKAIYHLAHALALLGELDLSQELLATAPPSRSEPGFAQLGQEVVRTQEYIHLKYPAEIVAAAATMQSWPGKFMVDWVSEALAVERIHGKGRGVRALRDIDFGETLILQRPRGSVWTDASKGEMLTSSNTDSGLVSDASQVKLTAQLTSMASRDHLLAEVLSNLEDGSHVERPVRSLQSFLDVLQTSVLPLLLQQADFFPKAERLELSYSRIQGVVNVNTHGISKESLSQFQAGHGVQPKSSWDKLMGGSTALYPAVSMINHSNEPNCVLLSFHHETQMKGMAISARRPIAKGQELTLAYLDDPEAVRAKWGIS